MPLVSKKPSQFLFPPLRPKVFAREVPARGLVHQTVHPGRSFRFPKGMENAVEEPAVLCE
jgi:hypothetical protein